jgi:hypothetical protein
MEKRYLVAIGINDYEHSPLNFCVKDTEDIERCFETFCGVHSSNAYRINSDTNTPNFGILNSLEHSINRIKSHFEPQKDSVTFYFSGHGVQGKSSTALLFQNEVVELQTIFNKLASLKPKFIFCLIDSCYSGVGISDGSKSADGLTFAQHLAVSGGYGIICASAADSPAKEDINIRNGRLTRLFIDTIQDKLNYRDGLLSLNMIFQLVDDAFKNNPEFRQFPFAQTKGVSTYPLAILNQLNLSHHYSSHYISALEDYDWEKVANDIGSYCQTSGDITTEFIRVARELIRNSRSWGNATYVKIEINAGSVSIIDNSGTFFNLIDPASGVTLNGGGITIKRFKEKFADRFSFDARVRQKQTIQTFNFLVSTASQNSCMLKITKLRELRDFQHGKGFKIPPDCKDYEIQIPRGTIDLSTVYTFLDAIILESQQTDKSVLLTMDKDDLLVADFQQVLSRKTQDLGTHKVLIKAE